MLTSHVGERVRHLLSVLTSPWSSPGPRLGEGLRLCLGPGLSPRPCLCSRLSVNELVFPILDLMPVLAAFVLKRESWGYWSHGISFFSSYGCDIGRRERLMAQSTSTDSVATERRLPRRGSVKGANGGALDKGRIELGEGRVVEKKVRPSNWSLKVIAAITGTLLALFVTVHMVGNLKVFAGPGSFNSYAHWLKVAFYPLLPEMGLLWIVRGVMGASLMLHVWSTLLIRYRGKKRRGSRKKPQLHSGAFVSRLMLWTGLVLLVFIVIHILDLTTGQANSGFRPPTATESFAYENLVHSFSDPVFATIYIVAMAALGLHLVHGLWLIVTDLGVTGLRTRRVWQAVAHFLAIVVALVNMSIPIAVLTGVVS